MDLMNSSSLANSLAIALVYKGSGDCENRWERICSEMRSFVFGEMRGMTLEEIRFK
jgi:hypothetical protein